MELLQLIKMSANFGAFSETEVAALVEAMMVSEFAHGHAFTRQGMPAAALYLVLEGAVAVTGRDIVNGAAYEPAVLREGELFSVYALLDDMPSDVDCSASGPVRAAWLDRERWQTLDARYPELGFQFQFMLASKLARDLQRLNESATTASTR